MPVTTLGPDTSLRLAFSLPRRSEFSYHVEADAAVDTYLLDEEGWSQFTDDSSKGFQSYASLQRRLEHRKSVVLSRGRYFLVVENASRDIVSVFYEIQY